MQLLFSCIKDLPSDNRLQPKHVQFERMYIYILRTGLISNFTILLYGIAVK
jgi:hypothetical protein